MADNLRYVICATCQCRFGIPEELHAAASHSADIFFYCPYGHSLHFIKSVKTKEVEQPAIEKRDNVIPFPEVRKDK